MVRCLIGKGPLDRRGDEIDYITSTQSGTHAAIVCYPVCVLYMEDVCLIGRERFE